MKDQYNTQLLPEDEAKFLQYLMNSGRERDIEDYDLRGAYSEGLLTDPTAAGHLPDTWKKPNHPTFSSESVYSTNGIQGGEWVPVGDKWAFQASPDNLKFRSPQELEQYFQEREPDSRLILPTADSQLKARGF